MGPETVRTGLSLRFSYCKERRREEEKKPRVTKERTAAAATTLSWLHIEKALWAPFAIEDSNNMKTGDGRSNDPPPERKREREVCTISYVRRGPLIVQYNRRKSLALRTNIDLGPQAKVVPCRVVEQIEGVKYFGRSLYTYCRVLHRIYFNVS